MWYILPQLNKGILCQKIGIISLIAFFPHVEQTKIIMRLIQDIASLWAHVLKVRTRENACYSATMTSQQGLYFLSVQRKSGMSEALYGQNDVMSSSYEAERSFVS